MSKEYREWLDGRIKLYHGDCMEVMKEFEDGSFDLVLTDPPYFNIAKDQWDRQWDNITQFQEWCGEVGREVYRILADNGSFYWFGDDKNIAYCQVELDKQWRLLNSLVWRKAMMQTMKGAESVFRSYAPITERILFYSKDFDVNSLDFIMFNKDNFSEIKRYLKDEKEKVKLKNNFSNKQFNDFTLEIGCSTTPYKNWFCNTGFWKFPSNEQYKIIQKTGFFQKPYEDLRKEYEELRKDYEELRKDYEELRRPWNNDKKAFDVLDFGMCQEAGRFHNTQKPINLISYLLQRSSNENDLICDPFAGSATTLRRN
jgi:site-specific DNA-methyltransferase (adenine-specific)